MKQIKNKILGLLALTSALAAGQAKANMTTPMTTGNGATSTEVRTTGSDIDLAVEANWQFHSLAKDSNAMFGPTMIWSLSHLDAIGGRGLVSVGKSGTYQAAIIYRRNLVESTKSVFYAEPSLAYNLVNNTTSAVSFGASIGFSHNLMQDLAIGGVAGVETYFGAKIADAGASTKLTPKASLVVSVNF